MIGVFGEVSDLRLAAVGEINLDRILIEGQTLPLLMVSTKNSVNDFPLAASFLCSSAYSLSFRRNET